MEIDIRTGSDYVTYIRFGDEVGIATYENDEGFNIEHNDLSSVFVRFSEVRNLKKAIDKAVELWGSK